MQFSETQGGKGELIKAPVNLQDLRRRIYVKAKADPFCGFRSGNFRPSAGGDGVGMGCTTPCGCSAGVGLGLTRRGLETSLRFGY